MTDSVLWGIDARGVATVTLNRAEVNNAYDAALIQGLHDAMDAIGARAGVRALLLRGEGRHFQAGGRAGGAAEARRIGLVHEVVLAAELQAAGEKMVDPLLQNAPEANALTKAAALELAWGGMDEAALERLVVQHAAKRRSREAGEGLASFAEKRPARW